MAGESFTKRYPAVIYGAITGVVIFIVGYITGMGGSFWPNVIFGALMGLFAGLCYKVAVRIGGRNQ